MNDNQKYTLRQASEQLGIPLSTVRYYCRKGLIPHVRRLRTGYRFLNANQLDWLRSLHAMRQYCNMSIEELRKYTWLSRHGASTVDERIAFLETKKRQLWQTLEDVKDGIDFIERREDALRSGDAAGSEIADL